MALYGEVTQSDGSIALFKTSFYLEMNCEIICFGQKFSGDAGITVLMDDITNALSSGRDMIMMGGGNPANIPEIEAIMQQRLKNLANDPLSVRQLLGSYDPAQGNMELIDALAQLFSKKLGWPVTRHNIALTNGSQSAFFMLFNMLAGEFDRWQHETDSATYGARVHWLC